MELVECATQLIHEYVQENLEHIHLDSFQADLIHEITDLLTIQFEGTDIDLHLLHMAFNLYSHGRTSLRSPPLTNVSTILEALASKPQPTQRTPEWYLYRHQLITASAAYKALGSDAKLNELICSKCAPMVIYEYTCTTTPMHWGVKYEPVSVAYYEYVYKTHIREYGCITHDIYPFLGASPDGINILESSPLYGRMLEIKNPFSRLLTGFPLSEYWIQCQLQMEVCNLDTCDFLETKFKEYTKEEFDADGSFQLSESGNYKGIILQFLKNDKVHYEYPPFQCTLSEYEIWEQAKMTLDLTWIQTIYWKLEDVSYVIIRRNKAWFQHHLPSWINAWNIIQTEKDGEWMKRLPKSKKNILNPTLPLPI